MEVIDHRNKLLILLRVSLPVDEGQMFSAGLMNGVIIWTLGAQGSVGLVYKRLSQGVSALFVFPIYMCTVLYLYVWLFCGERWKLEVRLEICIYIKNSFNCVYKQHISLFSLFL